MLDMKKFRERAGLLEGRSDPMTVLTRTKAKQESRLGMKGLGVTTKVQSPETKNPFDDLMAGHNRMYNINEEYLKQIKGMDVEDLDKVIESVKMSKAKEGYSATGYKGITQKNIESIIAKEAKLRNMDVATAIKVYRAEGLNSYQSQLKYEGKQERSYGPYQLFVDGGLGNTYQKDTGRKLVSDNTLEGITNQIRWSLDYVAKTGSWSPWKGAARVGIEDDEGLNGSKAINNWEKA
tara:strand:+ start:374 stop:1081 length:708 start_codon:yes stop_codon:yes gene_type:complete